MNTWTLPTSLEISGVVWDIRYQYPAILDILSAFNDPDFDTGDKWQVALTIFYLDFEKMPESMYEEACNKCREFIDMGISEKKNALNVMDWEQDAPLIIPEINKQIGNGLDVRSMPNMHWWTFLGYYMGIGESTFSHIINIRTKKAKGKKLEKWEKDFERENKNIVNLHQKLTEHEQAELEEEEAMLKNLF